MSLSSQVQPIFTAQCGGGGCHSGMNPAEGLVLSKGKSYASLVNVTSSQCAVNKRVVPGDPGNSYLMWKLKGAGPCFIGSRMPKGQPLSATEIDLIGAWIAQGAPDN